MGRFPRCGVFSCRRILLATVLAISSLSCERTRAVNVVLISIDTLRDDHCSVSGYARETTPNLEELAGQGARMELAYAPTATTGPTHATIFSSLYPIAHGLLKNGQILHPGLRTLAEILRDAEYRTAAVVSSYVLDAKFGYDQGFEFYDDEFDARTATWGISEWQGQRLEGGFDQPANIATDKALEWLGGKRRSRQPFFLFVHYFDPHAPYVPPEPFASRFANHESDDELAATIAAYDGEIAFVDQEIGRLLAFLEQEGLEENTLVVITADHGEGLMQHGHPHHGVQIYEEAVRVPLLFRLPGVIHPGRSFREPVALVDLAPTILGLVGGKTVDAQGQDLTSALRDGKPLDAARAVFLHRRHYEPGRVGKIPVAGEKFGVRAGPWKYIEGDAEGTRELFHLDDDPTERVNLYEKAQATGLELEARIERWKLEFGRDTPSQPELSDAERERLRSLGYVP